MTTLKLGSGKLDPAPANKNRFSLTVLGSLLLAVLFLGFQVFRPFLLDFTVAAAVALLMSSSQRQLCKVLRGRAGLAAGLLVSLVVLLLLLPVLSYAALLGQQAVRFFEWVGPRLQPEALQNLWRETLPERFPWLAALLTDWFAQDQAALARVASGALSRVASGVNDLIQGTVARLTTTLLDLMLFVMMLFFLLRDGPKLRKELAHVSPFSGAQEGQIFGHLEKTVKGVLQAMVLVPLAQGVFAMLGFVIFGVPAPLLWGVMVILAALIPLVGSPLAWVPAVIYLFSVGTTLQWVGMLTYGVVIISGLDNVIKPLILRDTARIHPLLGFLAILGGMLSFGPLGFLVGPVILSLILSAIRIYGAHLRDGARGPREVQEAATTRVAG